MLYPDWRVLKVDLARVLVLVRHGHLSDDDGDALAAPWVWEDLDPRVVQDLELAGGEDALALVPGYHS